MGFSPKHRDSRKKRGRLAISLPPTALPLSGGNPHCGMRPWARPLWGFLPRGVNPLGVREGAGGVGGGLDGMANVPTS